MDFLVFPEIDVPEIGYFIKAVFYKICPRFRTTRLSSDHPLYANYCSDDFRTEIFYS